MITIKSWLVIFPLLLPCGSARAGTADFTIDADYPGGNVRIVRREADAVTLAPDLRDTQGWWFHSSYGTAWNTANNTAAGRSNGAWARDAFPAARFAGSLEIPYADALGAEVNADSARALGRDLARAMLEHLGE